MDEGMKSTCSSNKEDPLPMISFMVPIPRASMEDPPMPVTVRSAIGCKVMKSTRSGKIWVVQALSNKKGDESKEREVC